MPNFKRIGGGPWKNGQKSVDLTWNDPFVLTHVVITPAPDLVLVLTHVVITPAPDLVLVLTRRHNTRSGPRSCFNTCRHNTRSGPRSCSNTCHHNTRSGPRSLDYPLLIQLYREWRKCVHNADCRTIILIKMSYYYLLKTIFLSVFINNSYSYEQLLIRKMSDAIFSNDKFMSAVRRGGKQTGRKTYFLILSPRDAMAPIPSWTCRQTSWTPWSLSLKLFLLSWSQKHCVSCMRAHTVTPLIL